MRFFATVAAVSVLLLSPTNAQDKDTDAMRDLQLGLQGIQEAAKNPALLAQLMQDLQVGARCYIWQSTLLESYSLTTAFSSEPRNDGGGQEDDGQP